MLITENSEAEAEFSEGELIGDLLLIEHKISIEDIVAITDMNCIEIDKDSFFTYIFPYISPKTYQKKSKNQKINKIKEILKQFPIFSTLPSDHLTSIANSFLCLKFTDGDTILDAEKSQNFIPFHIIYSGSVQVYNGDESSILSNGNYIGNLQIDYEQTEKLNLTVVAMGDVEFLSLSKQIYNELVKTICSRKLSDRITSLFDENEIPETENAKQK